MSLLLSASGSGRYLVDGNGNPFQLIGDSGWAACVQLTRPDVDTYLDNRQALGFNSFICELVNANDGFASNAPANAYGDLPFVGTPFASALNSAYWQHIDYIFTAAAARGIVVQGTIAYFGFNGGSEGWYADLVSAGVVNVQAYAAAVAARYQAIDNLIWVNGGDYFPPTMAIPNALAAGILSQDTRHLMTTHWARGDAGTRGSPTWLTQNSIYTAQADISSLVLSTYQNTTNLPLLLIEERYEGSFSGQPTLTPKDARVEAWQARLSGANAYNYGNHGIWPFASGWETHLNAGGAIGMGVMKAALGSMQWWTLVPDSSSVMVVSGTRGTIGTTTYVCASRSTDGRLGAIYLPNANSAITVTLSSFSGPVRATWIDPNNGTRVDAGVFSPSGTHSFSRSTANSGGDSDWALFLSAMPGPPAILGFWGQ
jgi:hypothetical protein